MIYIYYRFIAIQNIELLVDLDGDITCIYISKLILGIEQIEKKMRTFTIYKR